MYIYIYNHIYNHIYIYIIYIYIYHIYIYTKESIIHLKMFFPSEIGCHESLGLEDVPADDQGTYFAAVVNTYHSYNVNKN